MFKQALSLAILSTVASVASIAYAGSAHAIGLTVTAGSYRQPTVTNEGAFSGEVNNPNYQTFDFNNGVVPGNDKVEYSFSQGTYSTTAYSGQTGIYSDVWAPAGAKGEDNKSNYLAVFDGNATTIQTKSGQTFNYFGFDAGALSDGNTIKFFDGDKLVKELDYAAMNALAPVANAGQGGQLNGFFEFFSQGNDDNFNKIVLSQIGGGGFESDNHTFRIGKGAYAAVPEPGVVIGLFSVGGMFLRKRKSQKVA
jgi:hypothetical protein